MTEPRELSPSTLKMDDLHVMPMKEVFELVKDMEYACKETIRDFKIYSDNVKILQEFIQLNASV